MAAVFPEDAPSRWAATLVAAWRLFAWGWLAQMAIRLAFIWAYKPASLGWAAFGPALLMGARVEAKWLSIALAPAWLALMAGYRLPWLRGLAKILAAVALLAIAALNLVNFGFYGFYATPISPLVFGLAEDDTTAILQTLWHDWPIWKYAAALAATWLLPLLVARRRGRPPLWPHGRAGTKAAAGAILLTTAALFLLARGSLGTFPLRQQDYEVSPHAFVNAAAINGPASLYMALKSRGQLALTGDREQTLRRLGFAGPGEAWAALATRPS